MRWVDETYTFSTSFIEDIDPTVRKCIKAMRLTLTKFRIKNISHAMNHNLIVVIIHFQHKEKDDREIIEHTRQRFIECVDRLLKEHNKEKEDNKNAVGTK